MTQTVVYPQLAEELSPDAARDLEQSINRVQRLSNSDTSLQSFLEEYLLGLVDIYAATAGAIWFWAPDWKTIRLTTQIGAGRLGLTGEYEQRHESLLRYALKRANSFLVKPNSAPTARAEASNPTDSFLVFGPVRHQGDTIGVVELFLGPKPVRGRSERVRRQYVRLMDALARVVGEGVQRRAPGGAPRLQSALARIAAIRQQIAPLQEAIRQQLEISINAFEGWTFGGLEENREFAAQVHELLETNGLRIECPECGAAAILRCQAAGNAKSGVFFYDHYLAAGRTSHGGSTVFPRVKLTAKPPRRPGKGR